MKEIKIFPWRTIKMANKNEISAPSQKELGQLILDSIRINNEDIMTRLVTKNTEDSMGLTDTQLQEISTLINAVSTFSEDRALSQLLRYY